MSNIEEKEDPVKQVKQAISEINEQLDEHLDAINENTNEIQANYSQTCELETKLNKITEQLQQLQEIIGELTGKKLGSEQEIIIEQLTKEEQRIFLVLYTEERPVSYLDLAYKLNMSLSLLRTYITSMIEKGIPLQKSFYNNRAHVLLDKAFKDLQAKKNIVKLSQTMLIQNI